MAARSVTGHALDGNAGDLALRVEAKQEAGRVAAGEDEFYYVEGLLTVLAGLHNFGAKRRRSVFVEVARHCLDRVIRHLGNEGGGILRAVHATSLHLSE